MASPYAVLGVSRGATDTDIRKAYLAAAKAHHPDSPGGDDAKFREACDAFEVLSSPQLRAAFDQHGPRGGRWQDAVALDAEEYARRAERLAPVIAEVRQFFRWKRHEELRRAQAAQSGQVAAWRAARHAFRDGKVQLVVLPIVFAVGAYALTTTKPGPYKRG